MIVYICRGISGSGKSTAVKKIIPVENIFSTDDYWGKDYKFDPGKIGVAHGWNQNRVVDAMRESKSPIAVDNTNLTWWEIEPYVKMAIHYGYQVIFLEPDSPQWTKFKNDDMLGAINDFEEKNIHKVPRQVICKMVTKWQSTEEIQKKYMDLIVAD